MKIAMGLSPGKSTVTYTMGPVSDAVGRVLARSILGKTMGEELILKKLGELVCPSEGIVQWVIDAMRSRHQTETDNHEEVLVGLRSKIDRIERMDAVMYDDRLAGHISTEKIPGEARAVHSSESRA